MLHEVPLHQLLAEARRASRDAGSGTPQVDPGAALADAERVVGIARAWRTGDEARAVRGGLGPGPSAGEARGARG